MKSGDRVVLGTGSIVTHNGDNSVELDQSGLTFTLAFISGEGGTNVDGSGDGNHALLNFKNFDNPLGITWSSEVGKVEGRSLHLAVYIATLGDKPLQSRFISYTFSLEKT